jgi:hypothetical protein
LEIEDHIEFVEKLSNRSRSRKQSSNSIYTDELEAQGNQEAREILQEMENLNDRIQNDMYAINQLTDLGYDMGSGSTYLNDKTYLDIDTINTVQRNQINLNNNLPNLSSLGLVIIGYDSVTGQAIYRWRHLKSSELIRILHWMKLY